jgi:hypothetical protein
MDDGVHAIAEQAQLVVFGVRNHPNAPRFDRAPRDRFARKRAEARLGASA